MSKFDLLRREWAAFRSPGRLVGLAVAALIVAALGVLSGVATNSSCEGSCPGIPIARDGKVVSDTFWFLHRDLGPEGSITVRMTGMTGTITYPPPNHDEIVAGLVPWAKAGIIVKDGLQQGSSYAAIMVTGSHGVRFQYDYTHDVAGSASDVSTESPQWLRLTRSAGIITGEESSDGVQWQTVGTAILENLPDTLQVGLFAASPGDLTLRTTGLGGTIEEVRFAQAVGEFDNVVVEGGDSGAWHSDPVGEMNHTDWEKEHHASGAVESDGIITVSGTGDIGPLNEEGTRTLENTMLGLVLGLIVVIVIAARYGARASRETDRQTVAARAGILAVATFITALTGIGIAIGVGLAILNGKGIPVPPLSAWTGTRVIVGTAVVFALCAVLSYALGVWLRRAWVAALFGVLLIAVPYAVTAFPLLPDAVSEWILRLTPAAAFAIKQTMTVAYPQVTAHYAPSTGYFPLQWPAGLTVLGVYAAAATWLALGRAEGSRGQDCDDLQD